MIIGIGTDLCDSARIAKIRARFGARFAQIICRQSEIEIIEKTPERLKNMRLAKIFAAKEAASKALGTGMAGGVFWQDFETGRDARGAPHIRLLGQAAQRLKTMTPENRDAQIFLTLSDEKDFALAFVVIEASP